MFLHLLHTRHVVATWCSPSEWPFATVDPETDSWYFGFDAEDLGLPNGPKTPYVYFRILGLEVSLKG